MSTRSLSLALSAASALCLTAGAALAGDAALASGAVYTSTNEVEGNRVAIFARDTSGAVTFDSYVATGGTGTGAGLGNQGAVTLSDDGRFLFVVNAGSNDLSVFSVLDDGLSHVQTVNSGGLMPVSVAQHDQLVYVVNGGDDTIAGFRLLFDGRLFKINGAGANLSSTGTAPAQIGFSPDGTSVYVTEKATNVIDVYRLGPAGAPIAHEVLDAQADTPFGFAFGKRNQLFVSLANGGAEGQSMVSAHNLRRNGLLRDLDTQSITDQTAACWVVASPGGRLIYVSNTGSDTVSSFRVSFDGQLELLDATAANVGDAPLDMALTADGRFFYVLNSGDGSIGDYIVEGNGGLTGIAGSNSGLPAGASGLAAR